LQEKCACNIIHMDHFFLPLALQNGNDSAEYGSNIDFDRLQKEVISPLRRGEAFSYRPFNCASQQYDAGISFVPKAVNIIEGAYSCHPKLWQNYDFRIFLDIEPQEQKRRLLLRENAEKTKAFFELWIPREEAYFAAYDIAARCEQYFKV